MLPFQTTEAQVSNLDALLESILSVPSVGPELHWLLERAARYARNDQGVYDLLVHMSENRDCEEWQLTIEDLREVVANYEA